jgi:hypothetical protein
VIYRESELQIQIRLNTLVWMCQVQHYPIEEEANWALAEEGEAEYYLVLMMLIASGLARRSGMCCGRHAHHTLWLCGQSQVRGLNFYIFFTVLGIRIRVFGPPGSRSGSISQRYSSGSGSFPFLRNVFSGLK